MQAVELDQAALVVPAVEEMAAPVVTGQTGQPIPAVAVAVADLWGMVQTVQGARAAPALSS